ncbi:UNVERIFIED_CONTAM: hypothetical protein ABIC26_001508 [Paenibacillus sp. PvR008]
MKLRNVQKRRHLLPDHIRGNGLNPNQAKYATASSIEETWSNTINFGDSTTYGSQSAYVIPVEGTQTTSYLYLGDRWAGAWSGSVQDSQYVWLPLRFPTGTSLAMDWFDSTNIDTASGAVQGVTTPIAIDPDGYYQLVSRKSNKPLNVIDGATTDGADLEQRADSGASRQQWQLVSVTGGYYKLKNRATGKLIDISEGTTADGAKAIQWG